MCLPFSIIVQMMVCLSDGSLSAFLDRVDLRQAAWGIVSPVTLTALCKHWRCLDKQQGTAGSSQTRVRAHTQHDFQISWKPPKVQKIYREQLWIPLKFHSDRYFLAIICFMSTLCKLDWLFGISIQLKVLIKSFHRPSHVTLQVELLWWASSNLKLTWLTSAKRK